MLKVLSVIVRLLPKGNDLCVPDARPRHGNLAEWSKALELGFSKYPVFRGVSSNLTVVNTKVSVTFCFGFLTIGST